MVAKDKTYAYIHAINLVETVKYTHVLSSWSCCIRRRVTWLTRLSTPNNERKRLRYSSSEALAQSDVSAVCDATIQCLSGADRFHEGVRGALVSRK